jgi:hypothetical protein
MHLASGCSDQVSFSVRPLVAANLPELSGIQGLKHIADQIAFYHSFQVLVAYPCLGCNLLDTAMPSAALGPHDPSAPPP